MSAPGGPSIPIGEGPITVGRDPSASLSIRDPEVSAVHCELTATERGVLLRDLGSTNGTFVGALAIGEVYLTASAAIRVGQTELDFVPASEDRPLAAEEAPTFGPLVGASPAMRRLFGVLSRVAPTGLSVLITGETGTGKELAAQAIHSASARASAPLVVVDCGAIPATLAESVLFGHEKGSFTGAIERRAGLFREANGGTVFLDEIGELAPEVQPKLLRVLAEGTVQRVGSTTHEPVSVRVIAATRRDLRREINANRFRSDLFFRVAQVNVGLPPLRDRRQDIPLLIARACSRIGHPNTAEAVRAYVEQRFAQYDWPGNVRELMNVASVLGSMGPEQAEAIDHLLPLEESGRSSGPEQPSSAFAEAKRAFEETYFRGLLSATDGNISEMARRSGLARHQVRGYLRKLGLVPS